MTDIATDDRIIFPYTRRLLLAAGINPGALDRAARKTFRRTKRETENVPTATVQQFWDTFNAARTTFRRVTGEDMAHA